MGTPDWFIPALHSELRPCCYRDTSLRGFFESRKELWGLGILLFRASQAGAERRFSTMLPPWSNASAGRASRAQAETEQWISIRIGRLDRPGILPAPGPSKWHCTA